MTTFFSTKLGQAVVLAAVILACWWAFSNHYTEQGREECRAEQRRAQSEQDEKDARRDRDSAAAAREARESASERVQEIDKSTASAKEVVRYVYRESPAIGTCGQPLDPRVQREIDTAVSTTNQE